MAAKKSKTRKSTSTKTKPVHDTHISEPALKLIDKAAGLLKKAIIKGEEESVEGRKLLKKKALSFVDFANKRLTTAINEGSSAVKKGVRKI
jgi:hypothetical protein